DSVGDPIAPRTFGSEFGPQVQSLDVFVAIAPELDEMPNVDLEKRDQRNNSNALRFVREQAQVLDVNTGVGEHTVQYARPNVVLLLGNERKDSFVSMRVAQLVRTPTGTAVLRESLVPPSLRVGASPYLTARFRRLLGAMNAKQRSLAESRRQRSGNSIDFPANELAKFWLLQSLNATIPPIAHIVD